MKNNHYILKAFFVISIILIGKAGIGSPQLPDYIIYEGDTIPIYNLILEQYFENTKIGETESLIGLKFRDGASLNCWRGYQAIYQIKNDSLFLSNVISCGELSYNKPIDQNASIKRLRDIFKEKVVNDRVHLDWYSGNISLPNGKLLRWDRVFYKSFISEVLIRIKSGVSKETLTIENYIDDPNRLDRYDYYTPLFKIYKEIKRKLKWKNLPDDGRFWWEDFVITIGKDGKINKVINLDEEAEPEYAKAIKDALSDLSWDIIKVSGEPIEENFRLSLEFDFLFRRISDMHIDFAKKEQRQIQRARKRKNNNH